MASLPGPPPSTREHGHTGVASVRLRRTAAAKTGDSPKPVVLLSTSNQEAGGESGGRTSGGRSAGARDNRQESRRDQLFTFQRPRQEQLESSLTIAALYENVSALTTLNRREKALSNSLREEVARLTEMLAKLNGKILTWQTTNEDLKPRLTADFCYVEERRDP